MAVWFTADTHFGHPGILKHMPNRKSLFKTVDGMDDALIDAINAVVKPNDELWHLGDFCWKASKAVGYRKRLNVKTLHLIQGNHDKNSIKNAVSSMSQMEYRRFGEYRIHMTHYPMVSWRNRNHGSLHLYGHCHGSMEEELNKRWPERKAMDVGVDYAYKLFGKFKPFSLEEILSIRLMGI